MPRLTAEQLEERSAEKASEVLHVLKVYLGAMEQGYGNLHPFIRRLFANGCTQQSGEAQHLSVCHFLPGGVTNTQYVWCVLKVQDPHLNWLTDSLRARGSRIDHVEVHSCGCTSFYVYPRTY
jgi:hypothetical protein